MLELLIWSCLICYGCSKSIDTGTLHKHNNEIIHGKRNIASTSPSLPSTAKLGVKRNICNENPDCRDEVDDGIDEKPSDDDNDCDNADAKDEIFESSGDDGGDISPNGTTVLTDHTYEVVNDCDDDNTPCCGECAHSVENDSPNDNERKYLLDDSLNGKSEDEDPPISEDVVCNPPKDSSTDSKAFDAHEHHHYHHHDPCCIEICHKHCHFHHHEHEHCHHHCIGCPCRYDNYQCTPMNPCNGESGGSDCGACAQRDETNPNNATIQNDGNQVNNETIDNTVTNTTTKATITNCNQSCDDCNENAKCDISTPNKDILKEGISESVVIRDKRNVIWSCRKCKISEKTKQNLPISKTKQKKGPRKSMSRKSISKKIQKDLPINKKKQRKEHKRRCKISAKTKQNLPISKKKRNKGQIKKRKHSRKNKMKN